jgi:hypothetical protein
MALLVILSSTIMSSLRVHNDINNMPGTSMHYVPEFPLHQVEQNIRAWVFLAIIGILLLCHPSPSLNGD